MGQRVRTVQRIPMDQPLRTEEQRARLIHHSKVMGRCHKAIRNPVFQRVLPMGLSPAIPRQHNQGMAPKAILLLSQEPPAAMATADKHMGARNIPGVASIHERSCQRR